jgi:membrane dipeptidase
MVTFVPGFVSPACREWELELAVEITRQGLDPRDFASRRQVRAEWLTGHPRPTATLTDVADHVDHVRQVAGADHVGIGGDYDGTDQVPAGLDDVSCYPALFSELLARGWSEADCGKLASGNILRVMRDAEATARAISARRGPSVARLD